MIINQIGPNVKFPHYIMLKLINELFAFLNVDCHGTRSVLFSIILQDMHKYILTTLYICRYMRRHLVHLVILIVTETEGSLNQVVYTVTYFIYCHFVVEEKLHFYVSFPNKPCFHNSHLFGFFCTSNNINPG